MSGKKDKENSRSLKTLVIYGAFVFAMILFSLGMRVFYLVKQSKFDGQHRFTVVIREDKRVFGLVSFEPVSTSLSLLIFPKNFNLTFSDFNRKFGVIPDGYIRTTNKLSSTDTISSLFRLFIFHPYDISSDINYYDLLRLYLSAKSVPDSSVKIEEASIFFDERGFNKDAAFLLIDSAISSENVSIEIVNATGESGLGGRLERVISNLGGNVVSVKTALATERVSKIKYYGPETYTLRKLERLLSIKREVLDREDIARIVIIIGEDNKKTLIF